MSDWEPAWLSDEDARPRTVNYQWLDDNTGETLFSVDVEPNGLIHVIEDDWLSKYSEAIYGDSDVYGRYIRIDPKTKTYGIITNIDLIFENETILHVDSFNAFIKWKNKLEVDGAAPSDIPEDILDDVQSIFNWTTAAAAVEAVGWVLEFAPVGPVWVGLAAGGGLVVGLISAANDIVDTNNPELTGEQLFAGLYTSTAWVYEDILSTPVPATSENLGEFNPYIPALPFAVPEGVASPKSWFHIHDYYASHNLGTMSKSLILSKFNLMKNAWEDGAADAIENMDERFDAATRVLAGGDPTLTLDEFRRNLRSVSTPGLPRRELTRGEFFEVLLVQMVKTMESGWTGPTAPITLMKSKFPKYKSFYPLPK